MALDCGIENPEPAGKPEPLGMFVPDDGPKVKINFDARCKALEEAQREFVELAKANSADAALGAGADEIRVYRDGSFPAVGKTAAGALLNAQSGKMSFESMRNDMSHSADLSYTYGKYSRSHNGTAESGHFFQIWQTDAAGSWKLVLDWQQALPKEKP